MPKESFNKLNPGKQMKIKLAGIQEFSKYYYDNASINRIVKGADIARGSFYNYFEDLADLYMYCFTDEIKQIELEMTKANIDANGDFIESMYIYFSRYIDSIDYEQANLALNIINVQSILQERIALAKNNSYDDCVEDIDEAMRILDESLFKDNVEFMNFSGFAISLMFEELKHCIRFKVEKEHAKAEFKKKIEVLKYGAYKATN